MYLRGQPVGEENYRALTGGWSGLPDGQPGFLGNPVAIKVGRKWGTGHKVRKGEGSLGCCVHPCRYWHTPLHKTK
eukprot:846183-Pyramimonas_sp.AAC.1